VYDAARLAFGTLTVLPVPAPRRMQPGLAMLLAPVAGLVIGGIAAAVVAAVDALRPEAPLLSAVLGIATLAGLSGALHLDGLADTADGLGSRRDREDRLRIMRQGDVGPFGVTAIVLVLLTDVAALSTTVAEGIGWQAMVVAGVAGRTTVPWACRRGIPAARPEGLGSMVASTVRLPAAVVITIAVGAGCSVLHWPLGGIAVAAALAAGVAVTRSARRVLGGITGDTLGAGVELATTACLLTLAFGS
jgi:adenosylcobinamide-GDP ribazoletransferase